MSLSRSRLESVGHISQLGGTRLVELGDGAERGVRAVEFRNTAGLDFAVLVDRAFDIGWCRWNGRSLAWHSPTGFAGPWYREVEGLGFLRTFGGGLFATCGLDHILFPEEDANDTYNYPGRTSTSYGLHGRVSNTPAELVAHGIVDGEDGPLLRAVGRVTQAGALAEHLVLHREVIVGLDGLTISWNDTVTNEGWYPTPHMYLYHVNIGAPLLSATTELIAPIEEVEFRTVADGPDDLHLQFHGPQAQFVEQAFAHRMRADAAGRVRVAIINHDDAMAPWGAVLDYDVERFPHFLQWRYLDAGRYITGLEPSTNRIAGRAGGREAGELTILEPGQAVDYHTALYLVEGADSVAELRDSIGARA